MPATPRHNWPVKLSLIGLLPQRRAPPAWHEIIRGASGSTSSRRGATVCRHDHGWLSSGASLGRWLILVGRLYGRPDRFSGLGCRFGRWPFVVRRRWECPPGRG